MKAAVAPTIGALHETSLHAALKAWYARPGDELEASVEGFQIDLLTQEEEILRPVGRGSGRRPRSVAAERLGDLRPETAERGRAGSVCVAVRLPQVSA